MMQRRIEPNFIINNRPVSNYPAVVERVSCPICCIMFQRKYAPMISCPSGHIICSNCLQGIIKKAVQTPQNPASCPLCRKRIELPLRLNEEYTEFIKLLQDIGELQFGLTFQSNQLKKKSGIIATMEYQMKKKNQDLFEAMRKCKTVEEQRDKLIKQNLQLRKTIRDLEQGVKKRQNAQTDAQGEQKVQRKIIVQFQKDNDPNKQVEIDKRPPLKQLLYNDEVDQHNNLNLVRKNYSLVQMEFLAFHDLSNLVKIDLAFNRIENTGFDVLINKSNLGRLNSLNVANNNIREMPNDIQVLTSLEFFNIGNYKGEALSTCNMLKASDFDKMLKYKWENLKDLDVEFETDLIWQNNENLDKLIEQWPKISMINICAFTMKMTKKKCAELTKILNQKAKRPLNRIYVGVKAKN